MSPIHVSGAHTDNFNIWKVSKTEDKKKTAEFEALWIFIPLILIKYLQAENFLHSWAFAMAYTHNKKKNGAYFSFGIFARDFSVDGAS